MKALQRTWAVAVLSGLALLGGCGGGGDSGTGTTTAVTETPAETLLGVALLPPDGIVPAATALTDSELPPGSGTPGSDDMPPL